MTRKPSEGAIATSRASAVTKINSSAVACMASMAAANIPDPDAAPALTEGTQGVALGDRLFWRPRLRAELAQAGVLLLAPFAHAARDPWPAASRRLSRLRYRNACTRLSTHGIVS